MAATARSRVVVYRLGSLGDTVVVLPCLHKVAQTYPDAERIALTNFPVSSKAAPLQGVLGNSGLVHSFMAYPIGTRSAGELYRLAKQLRALGASTMVYLTPARGRLAAWRDLIYFRLCGFKHIIGVPLSADLQQNRRGADGLVEGESSRLARCIGELGPVALDAPASYDLFLDAAERQAASMALAPAQGHHRIAINMGGKVVENDWGESNWMSLAERLRDICGDHALVFIGAAEDHARAGALGARWPGPVVNLCGKVSPRVSAAAMAGSRLFVGHDSGPLHLAAAAGVHCVGLYGAKNEPRKWHPCGAGHQIIHDMRGVGAIGVEQVLHAIRKLLSTGDASTANDANDANVANGANDASGASGTEAAPHPSASPAVSGTMGAPA